MLNRILYSVELHNFSAGFANTLNELPYVWRVTLFNRKNRYEMFLNSMKTAVILIDDSFKIHYINDAALNMLETGRNQVNERPLNHFLVDDGLSQEQIIKAVHHNEDFRETAVHMCFKDGRCMTVDLNANIITIDGDRHALLEIIPIDKQRKITQETQQYAQQVAARELIRGLAHEIKNPLGGIRGAAQLLEKNLPNEEQLEFTKMIIDQADRLRNLVDRLLGPNSLPQKRDFNLHQILEMVQSVLSNDLAFKVVIERDYDPSIPDIFADPDMLQQAILNIARNASQALRNYIKDENPDHQPNIIFKTRIERQCVIKGVRYPLCAKISVIDNGPGIPMELRDTLFYPMVSSKKNGSGLGLSIAQTLTDHHHGKIDVESYPGFTEFCLYIPIVPKKKRKTEELSNKERKA